MSASSNGNNLVTGIVRIGVPIALISGLTFSIRHECPLSLRWAVLILVGEIALLLMGFRWAEIANAFRQAAGQRTAAGASERSTYFWEAAARNALHLGVLGTLVGFVIQICSDIGGQAGFMFALGGALLSTVYGLILAAILSTPAVRSLWTLGPEHPSETGEPIYASPGEGKRAGRLEQLLGHILFLVLMLWVLFTPAAAGSTMPFDWFVHWPAWLVVFGGALIFGLMSGHTFKTGSLVLGFACAGLIGSLFGVVQALQGFSTASIAAVSEGITFMISSCFAGFVGLLAIGLPLQDRSHNRRGLSLSRLVWYGYPVVALLLVALATLMVMVPIKIENS
ncbi:MAG: MotA/TolQ/ExbB proton channel family protein [Acidobacteriia bacterium]|nr:MotA/TolQ/ExbB proton channel family protein [Terriglobia bacterium]